MMIGGKNKNLTPEYIYFYFSLLIVAHTHRYYTDCRQKVLVQRRNHQEIALNCSKCSKEY